MYLIVCFDLICDSFAYKFSSFFREYFYLISENERRNKKNSSFMLQHIRNKSKHTELCWIIYLYINCKQTFLAFSSESQRSHGIYTIYFAFTIHGNFELNDTNIVFSIIQTTLSLFRFYLFFCEQPTWVHTYCFKTASSTVFLLHSNCSV